MSTTTLLLAVALGASATFAGDLQARRTDPRRPVVLVVHGRGFLSRDSAVFRREALAALREGAFRATGDSLLEEGDVRLVWYADLMDARHREARSLTSCDNGAGSSEEGSPAGFFLRSLAQMVSEIVEDSASDSGDGARDIAGDLRFVGDRAVRCSAQARVADALTLAHAEGRPVIIVAHSLGALVTWGYLEHRDARDMPEIERLVTAGSPIGNDGLRELLIGDTARVSLPRGVHSWVNAVNTDDGLAARIVASDATLPGVTDILTAHTSESAHDLLGYLRDSSTAMAVVEAWCTAAPIRNRVSGCVALSRQ
ncbi:MAG: hypothetical protein ABI664_03280 [bacterium]